VWAPTNTGGFHINRDLGVLAGTPVRLAPVQAGLLATGTNGEVS
jgi:hypothetical protein